MSLNNISLTLICLIVLTYDSVQISVGPCFMKNCLCTVKNVDIKLDLRCFGKNINRKSVTFENHFKIFVFSLKELNISELPQKFFFGLEIDRFDISSNNISSLSTDTIDFTGIVFLYSLDFFDNKISKIDSNALEPLYNTLLDLDFDNNQLWLETNILTEKSELNKLVNLRKLNLNKNNISAIPYLLNCKNLTSLILSNNNIYYLSEIFSDRIPKSIQSLDLSSNQISGIDQLFFEQFINLNMLNLKSNQLKQIADGTITPSIKVLYLNKNELEQISIKQNSKVVLFKIQSKKKFDIKISTTACFFDGCDCSNNKKLDIENVNCYEKNINKNSIVVYNKSNSVEISLKYLNISELPSNFFLGLKIVRFDISRNKISSLSPDTMNFTGIVFLYSLDFFDNKISKIDSNALEPLYNTLLDLDFDNNQLWLETNILTEKSELNKLVNLRKLNLNKNNISAIPYLLNCKNLTSLILSNNNIYYLSEIFSDRIPKSIQSLDLSSNQISGIDQLFFEQFINLNMLNLKSNQLKQIADGTITQSIKVLYLNKNSITKIPFIKNSRNIKLDLSNNKIGNILNDDFCSNYIPHPFLQIDSLNLKDNKLDTFHPCIYLGLQNSNEFIKIQLSKEMYNRNLINLLKLLKIEIPRINDNHTRANDTIGISENALTYNQIKKDCDNLGFSCAKNTRVSTIRPLPIIAKKHDCKAIIDLKNEISIDSLNIIFVINYCNLTLQFLLRNKSDSSAIINVNEEKNKYCNIIKEIKKEYNFSVNSVIKFQTCNKTLLLKESNVDIFFALKNITILNQDLKDDFKVLINDVIKNITESVINEDDEINIDDRFITKWGTPTSKTRQSSTVEPTRPLAKESNWLFYKKWLRYSNLLNVAAFNPSLFFFFLG
jgi:Leucine-rich repeat (LRR) protein